MKNLSKEQIDQACNLINKKINRMNDTDDNKNIAQYSNQIKAITRLIAYGYDDENMLELLIQKTKEEIEEEKREREKFAKSNDRFVKCIIVIYCLIFLYFIIVSFR